MPDVTAPTEAPVPARSDLPAWVDVAAYPFRPRAFDSGEGRLSYVDEGTGPPVVLVHGTPTWSFLYRRLIPRLVAAGHRVIAPDHLGFGLSGHPADADYRPEAHARRLAALLDALDLRAITLVLHDFGGPIGLAYALDRPARIARLVLLNTWGWALDGDPRIARGSRLAAGPLGRFLYTRLNASPRWLLPAGFADRACLTPAVHAQYLAPFPDAATRAPLWALARALLDSGPWYDGLWERRARLAAVPVRLVWGMRDPAFGPAYLARWQNALPHARAVALPDVGHFVPDEAPDALAAEVIAACSGRNAADVAE
ncbi:haloalkane dehalogenase [Gemmatimonadetes bacterium T265]|nr:haloalkane dehalogenase [Gemmatimonadetes bacterium T265]